MTKNRNKPNCMLAIFPLMLLLLCSCMVETLQTSPHPTVSKPTFPIENSRLIEVCMAQKDRKYPFPALQLEKENPSIDCLVYEIFTSDNLEGVLTPHPYGSMHFRKWTRSMNSDDIRLPRTVIQRQQFDFHSHKDKDGHFHREIWVEDTHDSLKKYTMDNRFVVDSYDVYKNNNLYTLSISLKCLANFDQEEWDHLCYSIFLKPDLLYREFIFLENGDLDMRELYPNVIKPKRYLENIAYDFVPLQNDNKYAYDGVGFHLNAHIESVPTLENPLVQLITAPFALPEIDYEDFDLLQDAPPVLQPKWSLHIILNDSLDMRKNLYSWNLPIEKIEK